MSAAGEPGVLEMDQDGRTQRVSSPPGRMGNGPKGSDAGDMERGQKAGARVCVCI